MINCIAKMWNDSFQVESESPLIFNCYLLHCIIVVDEFYCRDEKSVQFLSISNSDERAALEVVAMVANIKGEILHTLRRFVHMIQFKILHSSYLMDTWKIERATFNNKRMCLVTQLSLSLRLNFFLLNEIEAYQLQNLTTGTIHFILKYIF